MQLPPLAPATSPTCSRYHLDTTHAAVVLRPARGQVTADGEHLGPVGGRIVGEVIHGLIEGDSSPTSARTPTGRRPTAAPTTSLDMVDLLTTAGAWSAT